MWAAPHFPCVNRANVHFIVTMATHCSLSLYVTFSTAIRSTNSEKVRFQQFDDSDSLISCICRSASNLSCRRTVRVQIPRQSKHRITIFNTHQQSITISPSGLLQWRRVTLGGGGGPLDNISFGAPACWHLDKHWIVVFRYYAVRAGCQARVGA